MVDLAEGQDRPAASAHAQACVECGERLAQLKQMLSLTAKGAWNAPASSLSAVQQIFTPRKPVLLARLLTLGSGARSVSAESTQIKREAEGLSVRLMIRKEGAAWHVMGMVQTSDLPLFITCGAVSIDLEGNSFEFRVESLDEDLWLEFADRVIRVPLRSED